MAILNFLLPLITHVLVTQATSLFVKHFNKKIITDGIKSVHTVKGALHCEKLCLNMGDACDAANVIYTDGTYKCSVMADFAYNEADVNDKMVANPMGKFIIKQKNTVNCKTSTCKNGGTCVDVGGRFRCICTADYGGPTCGIYLKGCEEVICYNGGTCVSRDNGPSCTCVYGYFGVNCETEWMEKFRFTGIPNNTNFETVGFVSGQQYLLVAGKAVRDIVIALSMDQTDLSTNCYTVVLGGWGGPMSGIRVGTLGPIKVQTSTPTLLSDLEFRDFWISWYDAIFRAGTGTDVGESVIMSYSDPDGVIPKFVSFSGWDGSDSDVNISRALNPCFRLLSDTVGPCGNAGITHDDCLESGCCWSFSTANCSSRVAMP